MEPSGGVLELTAAVNNASLSGRIQGRRMRQACFIPADCLFIFLDQAVCVGIWVTACRSAVDPAYTDTAGSPCVAGQSQRADEVNLLKR